MIAVGWAGFDLHPALGLLGLAMSVVLSVVAMRATGEADRTPAGPLGGLGQLIAGIAVPAAGVPGTVLSGGAVYGTSAHSSKMLTSWKAGHLIGASPGRQLAAQLAGIVLGTGAAVLAYMLMLRAYGLGTEAIPAGAALSWKATAEVIARGTGGMPPGATAAALIAAAVAVTLVLFGRHEKAQRWLPSPVGIGIGFIAPANLCVPVAFGGLLVAVLHRRAPAWSTDRAPALAAGVIAGESLIGLAVAAVKVAGAL